MQEVPAIAAVAEVAFRKSLLLNVLLIFDPFKY
jgi:hypothetical protein